MVFCLSNFPCTLTLSDAHWLRRWFLWSATCPASGSGLLPIFLQPSFLSSICLLIVHAKISFLPLLPSLVHFQSLLFFGRGHQFAQGLCWFILGVAWRILHDVWCLPVWSVECLTDKFGASSSSCVSGGRLKVFSVQHVVGMPSKG
jgi:hypothetical protein